MRSWIKAVLLVTLVFGICWLGAIWYWQETNRMPATGELLLYMLALPLGLLFAFWLGRKLIAMAAAAPAAAAAGSDQADAAPPPPKPVPSLAILAAALRSPHGASAAELTEALAENKARSELDDELLDDDGFPVMAARIPEASDEALRDDITAWFKKNEVSEPDLSDEQWRALMLATSVCEELAGSAAESLIVEGVPAPMLQLMPILPNQWQLEQRRAAGLWLRHTLAESGWPAARINLAAPQPADARGANPAAVLGRLAYHAMHSEAPMAAVVIAFDSQIDQACVDAWSARGTLFTAARPQGHIPGEGAAGLLLTALRQAAVPEGPEHSVLDPTAEGRHEASSDDSKRTDHALLASLVAKSLELAKVEAAAVAAIVADTGHRSKRIVELMGLASAAAPQLDAAADVLRVGSASGTCGAVPFMSTLVMGHHHVMERKAPVLCISNEDPHHRCATLVRPAVSLS